MAQAQTLGRIQVSTPPKKHFNVYCYVPTHMFRDEMFPIFPEPQAQLYVKQSGSSCRFYTQAEIEQMPRSENRKVLVIGYAMMFEGQMHFYTNNPRVTEVHEDFTRFQEWLNYSVERFNALTQPSVPPEMPAESVTSAPQPQQVYSAAEIKMFLIAILIVFGASSLFQIVIALVK